ncbi:MAG: DUF99 family protein [Cyanobacteria bacterium J06623_7]
MPLIPDFRDIYPFQSTVNSQQDATSDLITWIMNLEALVRQKKQIRAIGFDDAPFERHQIEKVNLTGIVCANTRFEGMVWGAVEVDGDDANDIICQLLLQRKFLPQLHLVLLDGIGFGGFNLVDLPALAARLERPCVAMMRKLPNLEKMKQAMSRLPNVVRS